MQISFHFSTYEFFFFFFFFSQGFIPDWQTFFLQIHFSLNWTIVDLQCCVSFKSTTKWFYHTYTYSFSDSFPLSIIQFSSVTQSCPTLCNQHARPPCPSPTPRVHPNPCPTSQWCHPSISSSIIPFSSCPQSLPASRPFTVSQLFTWGSQSIGVSALASVLPMNTQDWSPLWWTGWISLQSKGLSRVFSNTTVQKHQFFSTQLSSQSNSHIHTWLLDKPQP